MHEGNGVARSSNVAGAEGEVLDGIPQSIPGSSRDGTASDTLPRWIANVHVPELPSLLSNPAAVTSAVVIAARYSPRADRSLVGNGARGFPIASPCWQSSGTVGTSGSGDSPRSPGSP